MAAHFVVSFCFLIDWGSRGSVGSAVWIASNASCLALQNPMKGTFLGSHCNQTWVFGYVESSSPSFLRCPMGAACSSCGDASSALFRAGMEGMRRTTSAWCCAGLVAKKRFSASSPGVRVWIRASASVTDSLPSFVVEHRRSRT